MKRVLKSEFGRAFTSDYVLNEAITTALVRTKRHDLAVDIGENIIESQRITKLYTTEEIVAIAWKKFQTFKEKPMSFTDCVSLALMEKNRIKQIMSSDSGFDGLTQRIC
jgi:hypothetical protein